MVVDGAQVADLLLDREDAAAAGARAGALFVDMTTIAPADARALGARLKEHGIGFLDAPVTGSAPKAADGTLTIMCGGGHEEFERARDVLEAMGRLVVHVGALGHGQTIKVVNNAVAAVNAATIAQALVVASAAGVDLDALRTVMGAGSGNSTMLELKGQPMVDHDFSPLFKLDHMLKDLGLCLEAAQAAGAPFPMAGLARDLYVAASARGLGEQDFAAVLEAVEGLAGRTI
jgi:3-hydroxyisobutyrate dehydrogenase-like beta-hydroxyacid dehydrogenase